jgi:hypothetical protein
MPPVHRLTDPNIEGGNITEVIQSSVFTNYLLTSVDGSEIEFGPETTDNGSNNVFIEYIPVNRQGDLDTTGDPRAEGSPNVFVNSGGSMSTVIVTVTPSGPPASALFQQPDSPQASYQPPYTPPANPPTREQNEQAGTAPSNPGPSEAPPVTDQPETKCKEGKPNVLAFLSQCLQETKTGAWRETGQGGQLSNPNILNMWRNIGLTFNSDQVPWCAGFACFAMKQSGLKWIREAGARNLANKLASGSVDPNYKEVSIAEMQPGDLVLWGSGHVNFCYTANGGKYTFVGGNQSPGKAAEPPVRDPERDGDVTISWPSGWAPDRGGVTKVVRLDC